MVTPEFERQAAAALNLPARYEIRKLSARDCTAVLGIMSHSHIYHSPLWPLIYPERKGARFSALVEGGDYLAMHQIESGWSYGIFDKEFAYGSESSRAANGACQFEDVGPDEDSASVLKRMDYPLVSVALAFDGAHPLDEERLAPLFDAVPLLPMGEIILDGLDKRNPESHKATAEHQVLMRNGTATRRDYEGQGLSKKLAHFLCAVAAEAGFKAIDIKSNADAVERVWMNPPKPWKAEVVCEVDAATYKDKDEQGKEVLVFSPSKQVLKKLWVSRE